MNYVDTNVEGGDIHLGASIKINTNGAIELPNCGRKVDFCFLYEAKN